MRGEGWKDGWIQGGRGGGDGGAFRKAVVLAGSVKVHCLMECCVQAAASHCTVALIVVVVVKEL